MPRPRQSLAFKAALGGLVLVLFSAATCGYLTAAIAGHALTRTVQRDARLLAETTARGLGDYARRNSLGAAGGFLERLAVDPRIVFITVYDADTEPVARRVLEPAAWALFDRNQPAAQRFAPIAMSRPVTLDRNDGADVVILTQPIWLEAADGTPTRLGGYLELAISDPAAAQVTGQMQATAAGAVALVSLLILPGLLLVARNWARALRTMVRTTMRLAEGQTTEPIRVRSRDEIGTLAKAFNVMAHRLSKARGDLEAANQRLEGEVERRTDQLHHANEQLRAQMREKDEFIRAIAHDLNAPVRNIAGLVKMLLKKHESDLADEALSKLHRINANAQAEASLLADLLEISRLRTNPGRAERLDLNAMLDDLAEVFSYDLEARDITLRIEPRLPVVWANANRMRQLFQNLLENAIKYMPADAAERLIEISCDRRAEPPEFRVRDTGRGIAEKDHQRIFQVFQRARYAGDPEVAGRGVGLASVKTLVESWGGRIWVDSAPGQGATFFFTFGASVMTCPDPDAPAKPPSPAAGPARDTAAAPGNA